MPLRRPRFLSVSIGPMEGYNVTGLLVKYDCAQSFINHGYVKTLGLLAPMQHWLSCPISSGAARTGCWVELRPVEEKLTLKYN